VICSTSAVLSKLRRSNKTFQCISAGQEVLSRDGDSERAGRRYRREVNGLGSGLGSGRVRVIKSNVVAATILAISVSLTFGGCGSSSSQARWGRLRSVSVTVAQPGIPPPGGLPRTTVFATSSEVARAAAALNRHHIDTGGSPDANRGCAGGIEVAIRIVSARAGTGPISLHAYLCGGHQSGATGDVNGFLMELHL